VRQWLVTRLAYFIGGSVFKHVMYFETVEECNTAENWIKANYGDETEDSYVDDDDDDFICFCFYTSNQLLVRQQQTIVRTVAPSSYRVNERM